MITNHIDKVVDVQIDITSLSMSTVAYNIILILGAHKVFSELYREYSSASELIDDGFLETDKEYIYANNVFSQSPRISKVLVGRRQIDNLVSEIKTVTVGFTYKFKVNTNEYTYTAKEGDEKEDIVAGLVLAGAADPIVTLVDNEDGTYQINNKVAGTIYTFSTDAKQEFTGETVNSITVDVVAIQNKNNEWYGIVETQKVKSEKLLLSAWVETNKKLYFTETNESDAINKNASEDTTSTFHLFREIKRKRTVDSYKETLVGFDAGLAGKFLAREPGEKQMDLESIANAVADKLTTNQYNNAISKKGNVYITEGGVDSIHKGTVFDDKFIYADVVRDLDYATTTIQEQLFYLLKNSTKKIPYTDAGIQIIEAKLKQLLAQFVAMNIFASDPAPITSVPKASSIIIQDKIDRNLRNVNFEATLAGAIQGLVIRGNVSF